MNIILKRHIGFYVLQVYVPCIMLVILSWVAFFINREATSDRSCIGIMCVLSLATLSFDVKNDIPQVNYITALDWFLIMCYLFLFASLIEFCFVHYFTKVFSNKKIFIKNFIY
jgi:gamma-aminobutyric acid receptor subunit alpha